MLSRVSMRKPPRRSITQGITWCKGPANVPHEEREYKRPGMGEADPASGKGPGCLEAHILRYI